MITTTVEKPKLMPVDADVLSGLKKLTKPKPNCRHEWRVVDGFYAELSRSERSYAVYCVYCLSSKAVRLTNKE